MKGKQRRKKSKSRKIERNEKSKEKIRQREGNLLKVFIF